MELHQTKNLLKHSTGNHQENEKAKWNENEKANYWMGDVCKSYIQ